MLPESDTCVIDARPIGPRGLLADEQLLGRSVLAHLIDLARRQRSSRVIIVAPRAEHDRILGSLGGEANGLDCQIVSESPASLGFRLRADRIYDPRRLRVALRRAQDPELATIWRLDNPAMLAAAEQEWLRRRTYQPLGKYWALSPARSLARSLRGTSIRPNLLTCLGAGSMFLAAILIVAWPSAGPAERLAIAAILGIGLILDIADGHLARIQGTSSTFGRWLDGFLDECADMALHAAIAWGQFLATRQPLWLVVGMLFGMGKFGFAYGNLTWERFQNGNQGELPDPHGAQEAPRGLRRIVVALGHADLRWHVWILFAAIGALHVELALFAAYYPARAIFGVFRKRRLATHG